jgi:hypothetical protein
VERGIVVKKIFQAYIDLIEIVNMDYKVKKKKIKKDFAEKLDKYINSFDDQLNKQRQQVEEY